MPSIRRRDPRRSPRSWVGPGKRTTPNSIGSLIGRELVIIARSAIRGSPRWKRPSAWYLADYHREVSFGSNSREICATRCSSNSPSPRMRRTSSVRTTTCLRCRAGAEMQRSGSGNDFRKRGSLLPRTSCGFIGKRHRASDGSCHAICRRRNNGPFDGVSKYACPALSWAILPIDRNAEAASPL